MDTLIKADIFFFVSTIVISLVAVLFIIVLIYTIRIIRNVDELSKMVNKEGQEIVKDVQELREKIKDEGHRMKHIAQLFGIVRKVKRKSKKKADSENE